MDSVLAQLQALTLKVDQLLEDRAQQSRATELEARLAERDVRVAEATRELHKQQSILVQRDEELIRLHETNKELMRKCDTSHKIGDIGQARLLDVLAQIKAQWGDEFAFSDVHAQGHQGDAIVEIFLAPSTTAQGQVLRIVLDMKYYGGGSVSKRHFNKAVEDARRMQAQAVVVVYDSLRAYPHGVVDSDAVSKMCAGEAGDAGSAEETRVDGSMVLGATLDALPVAIGKLAMRFVPSAGQGVADVKLVQTLEHAEAAWSNMIAVVAPILQTIDLNTIRERAALAQKSMFRLKNTLSGVREHDHAASLYALLHTTFLPNSSGRQGDVSVVLGRNVRPPPGAASTALLAPPPSPVSLGASPASTSSSARGGARGKRARAAATL